MTVSTGEDQPPGSLYMGHAACMALPYEVAWVRHAGLGKAHAQVRNQMQKANTKDVVRQGCARSVSRFPGLLLVAFLASGR